MIEQWSSRPCSIAAAKWRSAFCHELILHFSCRKGRAISFWDLGSWKKVGIARPIHSFQSNWLRIGRGFLWSWFCLSIDHPLAAPTPRSDLFTESTYHQAGQRRKSVNHCTRNAFTPSAADLQPASAELRRADCAVAMLQQTTQNWARMRSLIRFSSDRYLQGQAG
jgi:hypothetical protein